MRAFSLRPALSALLAVGCMLAAARSDAGDVLAEISVGNQHRPGHYYGRTFVFPEETRDYSRRAVFGYAFRQELPGGGVRNVEIARTRSRGAYLLVTDLFANGRFSTMAHTVVMMFPRIVRSAELYALEEDPRGDLHLIAPDGSHLWIDGETERLKATADFALEPPGAIGTPPLFRHHGLHLAIRAVGRSPFLRSTAVDVQDRRGASCRLTTDDLFAYDHGPESDVFRFDDDETFFAFLSRRCPALALPRPNPAPQPWTATSVRPASASTSTAPPDEARTWNGDTGLVPLLWRLFSY